MITLRLIPWRVPWYAGKLAGALATCSIAVMLCISPSVGENASARGSQSAPEDKVTINPDEAPTGFNNLTNGFEGQDAFDKDRQKLIAARGLRGEAVPTLSEAEPLLRPGETMMPVEAVVERGREPYHPPAGVPLDEVTDAMKVLCHVSPDQEWPTLSDFLDGTEDTLTVGMYDFTATHIADKVKADLKPARRQLQLVLDPGLALGNGGDEGNNPEANDVTEDEVCSDLEKALKNRFQFAWAAPSRTKARPPTASSPRPTTSRSPCAITTHSGCRAATGSRPISPPTKR